MAFNLLEIIGGCAVGSVSVFFVGAFDAMADIANRATSSAGNQVQLEILDEIKRFVELNDKSVSSISLKPLRTWPHGNFLWRGISKNEITFPPFINIAGLKRFIFSWFLLIFLLKKRPDVVVKYNLAAVEAMALLVYKIIVPSSFLVAIIQDVHYSKNKGFSVKQLIELLVMKLAARFDMLIPISERIRDDFGFAVEKTRVFNGGLTRQGRSILAAKGESLSRCAVFAGALEKYNGIDILIEQWISQNIDMELHVFGKGSCETCVHEAALHNNKIIFHGFRPEEEVSDWQKSALVNFCLRYSDGIDAGYFFPSKLFNVICAPGAVMANRFEGFPRELQDDCTMLSDDLTDLREQLKKIEDADNLHLLRERRKQWIADNANWRPVILDIFSRAAARSGVSL